jgi:hypothetical protein
VIGLILVLVVVLGFLGVLFWLVLRTDRNESPALGTNNPYPDGVLMGAGGDEPPYLPTPVISDREMFLRDADRRLAEARHGAHRASSTSWMEEPGAMESAGLVDSTDQG